MSRRLLAILTVVVLPLALLLAAVRGDATPATVPSFAALGSPSMPFVPHQGFINSTWFCPGVPIGGTGLSGSVTVANPSDGPLTGQFTVFNDIADTEPVEQRFEVPSRDTLSGILFSECQTFSFGANVRLCLFLGFFGLLAFLSLDGTFESGW